MNTINEFLEGIADADHRKKLNDIFLWINNVKYWK
jgi:hypothetical protein